MAKQLRFLIGYLMIIAAAAATLLIGATADTYTVGDELGWTVPPLGNIAYTTWAASKDFDLGDIIEFRWNSNHSVAEVSKEDYDNCNITNPIGTVETTSPFSYTLNTTNPHYFVCTVGNHCSMGQKLTINTETSAAVTASALSAIFFTFLISFLLLIFM